ncbi:MAG: leucyl aminopeptidase [Actinomycetota bacterium]|nr:leucyl aminopeptidase [Actinomycetota bacterium]
MTSLSLSSAAVATLSVDAVVVGLASSAAGPVLAPGAEPVDAALADGLLAAATALGATGAAGQVHRIATMGALSAPLVVCAGLGDVPAQGGRFAAETLRRATGAAVRELAGTRKVAVTLAAANGAPGQDELRAVSEGALLGAYEFARYRNSSLEPRHTPVAAVTILVPNTRDKTAKEALRRAEAVSRGVALTRDLVNTPPGDLHPAELADAAVAAGAELGLEVIVLDERKLKRGGYGGILGVGQGSTHPPRLVEIRYRHPKATHSVALVGKGITFDSGGLSLKPSASMEWMKSDMGGAGAVLGAMVSLTILQPAVNVTGWLPTAENMPSGAAIRPSDVLHMYGGKKVEVLNTDAEGRLVLGDAIARACEDSPDLVIDVATLTGAQLVALGSRTAGVMSNDDGLRAAVVDAADRAGELMWPMPLPPELRKSIDSDIADLSNTGDRYGGMLVAGLFLQEFVSDGTKWAHLDIAGPSFNRDPAHGYTPKGGTGVAVRTLVQLIEDVAAGSYVP